MPLMLPQQCSHRMFTHGSCLHDCHSWIACSAPSYAGQVSILPRLQVSSVALETAAGNAAKITLALPSVASDQVPCMQHLTSGHAGKPHELAAHAGSFASSQAERHIP